MGIFKKLLKTIIRKNDRTQSLMESLNAPLKRAIEESIEVWEWLKENFPKDKKDYIRECGKIKLYSYRGECPVCEYMKDYEKDTLALGCDRCIIKEECFAILDIWDPFTSLKMGDENDARLAIDSLIGKLKCELKKQKIDKKENFPPFNWEWDKNIDDFQQIAENLKNEE